jgi:hypothetical protein
MADIARHPRMIGIVAAMGGEVEGDGDALLAGGEVAPVEGVGILGGGEAGILPDGPRPLHIHRGVGAAEIGRHARHPVEEIEPSEIARVIGGLDGDPFRRLPGFGARGRIVSGARAACGEADLRE